MQHEITSWDLSELYQGVNDSQIESDMKEIENMVNQFVNQVKSKIKNESITASQLREWFEYYEQIREKAFYINLFSSLSYSTSSLDDEVKNLRSKVQEFSSKMEEKTLFFFLDLNRLSDDRFSELIGSEELSNYKHELEFNRREKPHQLSEKEEQIILMKNITGKSGFIKLYGEIESGFTYEFEVDGEVNTYTSSDLFAFMYHNDKDIRYRALQKLLSEYKKNELLFTHIFNNVIKDYGNETTRRNFEYPIAKKNLENEIGDKVVTTLGEVTSQSNKIVEKYYNLKKKIIGLSELRMSDMYAPVGEVSKKYSYDEAISLVKIANGQFDSSFSDIVDNVYNLKHIDVTPRKGKQGGAFCSYGKQKKYPFVFVNFTGDIDSVLTLAHELGHAIHHYFIQQKQTMQNIGSSLPVAEIASVFNEMITFDYLMKQDLTKEDRIALLANHIEGNFGTSHRQNAFYHFERKIHELMNTKLPTAEDYKEIFVKEMQDMFGNSIKDIKEDYGIYWTRVGHFIWEPFYVYAYNMSNLLVIALYQMYLEEGQSFVPKFIKLLAVGTSKTPEEMLSEVNIDLNDPNFWNKGIKYLSEKIDELESLLS